MKKIDLGQTINTIANLGVIMGILLLAVELQQNNKLMTAEARATMVEMNGRVWESTLAIEAVAPMHIKDRQRDELTIAEEMRLNAIWIRALYNAEYVFEEDSDRFPVEMWRRAFTVYGALQRAWNGGGPGSALTAKDMFTPEFIEFFDSTIIGPQ